MTAQYSEATVKLEKAMQIFKDIGDSLGATQCLRSLLDILKMTDQYSKPTIKLETMQIKDSLTVRPNVQVEKHADKINV